MKILFLDIDGVVNCSKTTQQFEGFLGIDPFMALLVDRIIQATRCKVVLSSSWRNHESSVEEVKKRVCGLYGMTPNLDGIRGEEIKAWADDYTTFFGDKNPITHVAILDDNSDMLPQQMSDFFKTLWQVGLTEEIANKVIEHLNK